MLSSWASDSIPSVTRWAGRTGRVVGRRWSTALIAADCTSVVGWRLALSMITTEGVQGWYGRSSSMTAASLVRRLV